MAARRKQVDLLRGDVQASCELLEQVASEATQMLRQSAEKIDQAVARHKRARAALNAFVVRNARK